MRKNLGYSLESPSFYSPLLRLSAFIESWKQSFSASHSTASFYQLPAFCFSVDLDLTRVCTLVLVVELLLRMSSSTRKHRQPLGPLSPRAKSFTHHGGAPCFLEILFLLLWMCWGKLKARTLCVLMTDWMERGDKREERRTRWTKFQNSDFNFFCLSN